MKFVQIDLQTGAVSWDRYFAQLEAWRDEFPEELYRYAANWENYSLDGETTLHDAWLEEIAFDSSAKSRPIKSINLVFLGAFHDRRYTFKYMNVYSYVFELRSSEKPGYRDLLAHEFRIENQHFVHELVFADLGSITLEFEDVRISSNLV